MPIKDLYKNKYLKYKNKYLNLQNQIGGGLQIYNSCNIYNITAIFVKLIILLYKDYNFDMEWSCKYFYDVEKHYFNKNIFEKLEEIFNFKSDCDGIVLLNFTSLSKKDKKILKNKSRDKWLKELNTSLLFNFIYLILKKDLKCEGGDILYGCDYILNYFKTYNITIDIFKEKIEYTNLNKELQDFFHPYIVDIVTIFYRLYTLLNSDNKPICYTYNQDLQNENSFNIIESLQNKEDYLNYKADVTTIERPDILETQHFAIILIYILYQGFYALFQIDNSVIIITGCTGFTGGFTDFTGIPGLRELSDLSGFHMNFTKIFLNVENSYCPDNKWCELINNNKIKLSDIINYNKFYVLFLYPTRINNNFIIYNNNIEESNLTNENVKIKLASLNVYSQNIDLLINLTITDSKFDNNDIKILKKYIENSILKKLNLSNNGFTDKEVALLLESLVNNITLLELTLSFNKIHDRSMVLLKKYIEYSFIKLRILNLESTFKDAQKHNYDTALTIATPLTVDTPLINVTVPNKNYRMEIVKLANALSINKTLTEVNIKDNSINDFETISLAYALKTTSNIIKFFNLSNNNIGDFGATQIAKILNKLESINLSYNNIGDIGAIEIGKAMIPNIKLKFIHLNNNEIGDEGITQIKNALRRTTTLQIFNIKNNRISSDKYEKLIDILGPKGIKH